MTRVTSALVLAMLLGTAGIRLGCAWSCQPPPAAAAEEHCHEASVAAFEFSAPTACSDARSGDRLLALIVRPEAPAFATVDRVTSVSLAADNGVRPRPAEARHSYDPSPHAFAIPLRQ